MGGGGAKGKGREGVAMILCQTPNILPSGGRCRKAVFGVCACVSQFSVCVWRAYVCVCVCVCVCVWRAYVCAWGRGGGACLCYFCVRGTSNAELFIQAV